MNVSGLLSVFDQMPAYADLVAQLKKRNRRVPSLGLLRSAQPALVAALMRDLECPMLVIAGQVETTATLVESLGAWSLTPERVTRFPEPLPHFFERAPWSREAVSGRLSVLAALAGEETEIGSPGATSAMIPASPPVVVASARALMQPTMPRHQYQQGTRSLRTGQLLDLERALTTWIGLGYRPAAVVESPGELSRRGGIIDIFPPAARAPIRIELFGDEIESLRHFDPATQRSQNLLARASITPATEAIPWFGPRVADSLAAWDLSALSEDDAEPFSRDKEALANGNAFDGIEFYLPFLYSRAATLLDYFPPEGLVLVMDQDELARAWTELESHARELRQVAEDARLLPPDYPQPFVSWERWETTLADRAALELGYSAGKEDQDADGAAAEGTVSALARAFKPGPRFGGQLKPLVTHIRASLAAGDRVVVVSRQASRLAELWGHEDSYLAPLAALPDLPTGRLTFVHAALAEGWGATAAQARWQVLTDAETFGWARPQPRRRRPRKVAPETFFADMTPEDYVVHIEHGIGIFRGLTTLELETVDREYLLVQYEGKSKLYVPIHQADRLGRYVGAGDRPPQLNRLGGAEWSRVRKQAQRAVEEVAQELLELYAAREAVSGYGFGPDTPWQAELEAAFPYIETEDQLRAIEDVKTEMELARPMDRLICGDVGYGKTEVALRGAFKAVMGGKQVAILVPTTILAQQHYNTFRERLQSFPVEVEMLSRFRSRQEQMEVLARLLDGQVDIVIGTHRLLSGDVGFKDLGLLIIDEEQRFGVTHKERLKQMRTEVDVLTMTATPIPRTLYMSLTGVRDISTIDTPPEERLPVRTHVGLYDDGIIRHAVLREIDRGGQVFFVHNRVMSIDQVHRRIQQLVPEVTVGVAHGQMHEAELERAMLRFVNGSIDVLLSTSIIESGLDIPNANTLIVNQADRFGLAQLYQLRGRVGRGAQRAYAYFFYDSPRRLTGDARRRLETIREASELGAGFTIAMRDLEIRGSGDILGMRQHGHISAVGFDLYTRLLAQAVHDLKARDTGETLAPTLPAPISIALPLGAFIPSDYVFDNTLRLRLYRRMAQLATLEEVDAFAEELADRFGPIPDELDNLLYQLRLKVLAGQAAVEGIAIEDGKLAIRCTRLERVNRSGLQRRLGRGVRISRQAVWIPYVGIPQQEWRVLLVQVLEVLAEV